MAPLAKRPLTLSNRNPPARLFLCSLPLVRTLQANETLRLPLSHANQSPPSSTYCPRRTITTAGPLTRTGYSRGFGFLSLEKDGWSNT
ncbi:hypothetical protein IEQ34_013871 [Dendrobium chrysotoxum]|uniref:Uncharacterized protein n=1 Tax=Dendrobium chrysotoxum TaxID=161865 RepID=A0AAV7GRD5_DENCH|nr:hypothetical protein IEQ34_013871 [Dendrobium chrysotoxum]